MADSLEKKIIEYKPILYYFPFLFPFLSHFSHIFEIQKQQRVWMKGREKKGKKREGYRFSQP